MEVTQCERGHFYDASVYSSCPQCEEEMRNPQGSRPEDYGNTMPVGGFGNGSDYGNTMPVDGFDNTDPSPSDIGITRPPARDMADSQGPVLPKAKPKARENRPALSPVVGWLVCVNGPEKGKEYRIQTGYNYIGRSESMTICINDQTISRERHAMIAYDRKNKVFKFAPYMGENAVEVNGDMIMGSVPISAYDELTIGNTTLIFIPLCGERFNWDER